MANPVNIAETAEFKDAVDKIRQEANRSVVDALAAARVTAGTAGAAGDANWAETFAMAIAQLTDQGTGRTHVAPEILRTRQEGREKMAKLIVAARAEGAMPSYRLTSKVLLDNQLVEPFWIDRNHIAQPTEIDWPGVPNEAMLPINGVAKDIFAAFMDSIGGVSKLQQEALSADLSVTAGGLTVRGNINKRTVKEIVHENSEQGLRLRHQDEPGRYKDVSILGSIAKPAQQSI